MKTIVVTSLTIRFYARHGWTLESVNEYVVSSKEKKPFHEFDFYTSDNYWIPKPGTILDTDKLAVTCALVFNEKWGELKGKNSLEILRARNDGR